MAKGPGLVSRNATARNPYAYQSARFTAADIASLDKEQRDLIIQNYMDNLAADAKAEGREGKAPSLGSANMFVSIGKIFKRNRSKRTGSAQTATSTENAVSERL